MNAESLLIFVMVSARFLGTVVGLCRSSRPPVWIVIIQYRAYLRCDYNNVNFNSQIIVSIYCEQGGGFRVLMCKRERRPGAADGLQNITNLVLADIFTSAKSNPRAADMRPTGDEIVIQREGSYPMPETPHHDFVYLRDTIDQLLDAEWDKVFLS